MSKLSTIVCALLLVSVACEQNGESESQNKFGAVRAACVESITLASSRIEEMYYNSVENLPNPDDKEAMTELYLQVNELFEALIPMANSVNTSEVPSHVVSVFGDVVRCPKSLAFYVRAVTKQIHDQFNELLENPQ